jgi:hypothetical protein
MTMLLAHHLEAHHIPVLTGLFAAGFFIGWQALSRWLTRWPVAPTTVRGQESGVRSQGSGNWERSSS